VLYETYFFSFLVIPIFIFRTIPSKMGFYKTSNRQSKKQHLSNSKPGGLLRMLINFELNKVTRGKSIFFGSSMLLVARKR
jgi:hypothetical protein